MAPDDLALPRRVATRLWELAFLFLKLGTIGFGGPAAHIAMMEDEVVTRRRWIAREEFLDLVAATNLIPGPNSTEMAIHIGWLRAGWVGLVVAGTCFILPAVVIVSVFAAVYVRYASLPAADAVLVGVKPVVVAIVLQGLARLMRTAVKSIGIAAIGVASIAALIAGVEELLVLAVAAAAAVAIGWTGRHGKGPHRRAPASERKLMPLTLGAAASGVAVTAAIATPVGLWPLFLAFLKIGSVLFGSGYVLLAFLRAEFVVRLGWLTEGQILDATAVGLVTPGPVFTSATFIGWILAGPAGAATATIGIFLPAFFFVAVTAPFLPRLRRSPGLSDALDGLNVASLALLLAATWQLGRTSIGSAWSALVAVASLVALVRFRVGTLWLLALGGLVGVCVRML
jgi:chromate transporter